MPEIEIMAGAQYEGLTNGSISKIWPKKPTPIQQILMISSQKNSYKQESMELWHKSKELDFLDLVEKWKSKVSSWAIGSTKQENLQDALTNLTMKDEEYRLLGP